MFIAARTRSGCRSLQVRGELVLKAPKDRKHAFAVVPPEFSEG
jgi:hypothetical protein